MIVFWPWFWTLNLVYMLRFKGEKKFISSLICIQATGWQYIRTLTHTSMFAYYAMLFDNFTRIIYWDL